MIIVRVPFRITLGGGGTDNPSYADRYGGIAVTATLQQYMLLVFHPVPTYGGKFVLRYREVERSQDVKSISHPLVSAALRRFPVPQAEITSVADLPANLGLGSSAAFTVALLMALHVARGEGRLSPHVIAEEAVEVERSDLARPVGRQDQYACAYGGLCRFDFHEGYVSGGALPVSAATVQQLEEHLVLFRVPPLRDRGVLLLTDQETRTKAEDAAMLGNLHATREIGHQVAEAIRYGCLDRLGRLFDAHWSLKRTRSEGITNGRLDAIHALAKENGAAGGKLVGAGGGGCFLFWADEPDRLRQALAADGLQEIPVRLDNEGPTFLPA